MKKSLTVAALIGALALGAAAPAQADIKVGFVDMNKVFSSYYKTKDAEGKIREVGSAAKKELDDRVEVYKKSREEILKLNEELAKPELSKEAKEKKQKDRDEKISQFNDLEREINEFRTTREKQIQEQMLRMRETIVKDITALIQDKVKKENYDLVLDKSGNSSNNVPLVLFSKDTNDFSDEIITTLNKDKPASSSSSSSSTGSSHSTPSGSKKK